MISYSTATSRICPSLVIVLLIDAGEIPGSSRARRSLRPSSPAASIASVLCCASATFTAR